MSTYIQKIFIPLMLALIFVLLVLFFNIPIAISQESYIGKNLFITREETYVIQDYSVDHYISYLYENRGFQTINMIYVHSFCFNETITSVYVVDMFNKNKGGQIEVENGRYCFKTNKWESPLEGGASNWIEFLFVIPNATFVSKQDNLWKFTRTAEIPGGFNITLIKLKLPSSSPFHEPLVESSLPSPDFIYDELKYKVFVWNLPQKNIANDERIVKYIQFEYRFSSDFDKIKWDIIILFSGFLLGLLTNEKVYNFFHLTFKK